MRSSHGARRGRALGKTCTSDVVDATVATLAASRGADVIADDAVDLRKLVAGSGTKVAVLRV